MDQHEIRDMVDERLRMSLDQHKNSMLSDMEKLLEKISESSSNIQLNKFSNILTGVPAFKRKSNEEQYKYNSKVTLALDEAEQLLGANKIEESRRKIAEAKTIVTHRQKLIRLADTSELGWRVVSEYEANPLASDSDDEKRIYKAETRASRKLKTEKSKKQRNYKSWPYKKPVGTMSNAQASTIPVSSHQTQKRPGLCFACGKPGHWKGAVECPAGSSNNKMSISLSFSQSVECKPFDGDIIEISQKEGSFFHDDTDEKVSTSVCEKTEVLSPVNRLKMHIHKWREATDSEYICDVVEHGYKLPFRIIPEQVILRNNKSARENSSFVVKEIQSLLSKGIVSKLDVIPHVVNPLTVAYNKQGKPRLVLDCRHLNPALHQFKVKFEDISVAETLFGENSFLFTFDLKSAYHHIDIFSDHRTYLGFCFPENNGTYYMFNSLPFGIKTAGHIFTKILKVVVTYLRSHGHKIIMFLDDGIGGHTNLDNAVRSSEYTKQSLVDFGFLLADDKCNWTPRLKIEWLGHILDMKRNLLFVSDSRIDNLEKSLDSFFHQMNHSNDMIIPVKFLASVAGQIISLKSVIGNRVRLLTRHTFSCINSRASWNAPVKMTENAIDELKFWRNNVSSMNKKGKPLRHTDTSCLYNIFADASGLGYGGYVEKVVSTKSSPEVDNKLVVRLPEINNMRYKPSEGCTFEGKILTNKNMSLSMFPEANNLVITESPEADSSVVSRSPEADSLVAKKSPEVDIMSHKYPEMDYLISDEPSVAIDSCLNEHTMCPDKSTCLLKNLSNTSDDSEVVGAWSDLEKTQSSTWRETEAINRVIQSHGNELQNSHVKVYSDNKNVKSVLLHGSRVPSIHEIAIELNNFCDKENIVLCPEWIPREENEKSDHLSRCFDSDDWQISLNAYQYLNRIWGPHTIDRFASNLNSKCQRFNSRWWVPGTEAIDAFDQPWGLEINWLVPPPRLALACINKMITEKAKCTLIVPNWQGAPFWPVIINKQGSFNSFIKDIKNLGRKCVICGKGNNGCFGKNPLSFDILALRCTP